METPSGGARPAGARSRPPDAPWLAVGTVCIGAFVGQLDASIVTVAYATLHTSFHAELGAVTWVGLTYLLVLVALLMAVGRFADMAGRELPSPWRPSRLPRYVPRLSGSWQDPTSRYCVSIAWMRALRSLILKGLARV